MLRVTLPSPGRIRGIICEDIRAALDRGDNRHAAEPVSAWRHSLNPPCCAARGREPIVCRRRGAVYVGVPGRGGGGEAAAFVGGSP